MIFLEIRSSSVRCLFPPRRGMIKEGSAMHSPTLMADDINAVELDGNQDHSFALRDLAKCAHET